MLALEAGSFEPLCVVQRAYFLIDDQISLFHERKLFSFIVDVGENKSFKFYKMFLFFLGSPGTFFCLSWNFLSAYFLSLLMNYLLHIT